MMSKMRNTVLIFIGLNTVMGLTGCELFREYNINNPSNEASKSASAASKAPKASDQTLCDVERTRARSEVLKRIQIENFRELALKVSRAVSSDEVKDLKKLEAVQFNGSDWEIGRARGELVAQIYTDAIIRAGFLPPDLQTIPGTTLSATIGLDTISASNDRYAEFLVGTLENKLGEEGSIAKVSLAANPDQSRYFVRVYRLSRVETKRDGSLNPVFTTENLFDAAEERVPRTCDAIETALNAEEFNTIPGLTENTNQDPTSAENLPSSNAPQPAPSALPTTPAPQGPAEAVSHAPAPAPAPQSP
jgi:hypothetical protein